MVITSAQLIGWRTALSCVSLCFTDHMFLFYYYLDLCSWVPGKLLSSYYESTCIMGFLHWSATELRIDNVAVKVVCFLITTHVRTLIYDICKCSVALYKLLLNVSWWRQKLAIQMPLIEDKCWMFATWIIQFQKDFANVVYSFHNIKGKAIIHGLWKNE